MMQVQPIVGVVAEQLVICLVENTAGGREDGTEGSRAEDRVDRVQVVLAQPERYPLELAALCVGVEVAHIVRVELGERARVHSEDVRQVAHFVDRLRLGCVDTRYNGAPCA